MKHKMAVMTFILGLSVTFSFVSLAGWQQDAKGWWYAKEDAANTYAIGDTQIDGIYYWFSDDGYMQTGWKNVSGNWFYYDADGKRATGWRMVNGKWYYMDNDGRMQTGWLKLDGKTYFLRNDGMVTGAFEEGQYQYQTDETGALYTNIYVGTDFKYNENGILMYRGKNNGMQWEYVYSNVRYIEDLQRSFFKKYVELNEYSDRGAFEKDVKKSLTSRMTPDDIDEFLDYAEEEYDLKYGKRTGHYYSEYTKYQDTVVDDDDDFWD